MHASQLVPSLQQLATESLQEFLFGKNDSQVNDDLIINLIKEGSLPEETRQLILKDHRLPINKFHEAIMDATAWLIYHIPTIDAGRQKSNELAPQAEKYANSEQEHCLKPITQWLLFKYYKCIQNNLVEGLRYLALAAKNGHIESQLTWILHQKDVGVVQEGLTHFFNRRSDSSEEIKEISWCATRYEQHADFKDISVVRSINGFRNFLLHYECKLDCEEEPFIYGDFEKDKANKILTTTRHYLNLHLHQYCHFPAISDENVIMTISRPAKITCDYLDLFSMFRKPKQNVAETSVPEVKNTI